MTKILLTPSEVCEILGIGRSKLYQLLQAGEIESVRLGGRCRRIPSQALEEYVARLRGGEAPSGERYVRT